jgi:uncharacterized protein
VTTPPPGAIDCDIHLNLPSTQVLLPHFNDYWREIVTMRGLDRDNFETHNYPINAPISARPDWRPPGAKPASTLDQIRTSALDRFAPSYAICNVIHGAQAMYSEDLSAAFCSAINDWVRAKFLDHEPRLRASIVVPGHGPERAAEEIDRCAPDPRFVGILLLAMQELPLGRRQNWPIYRAAQKHGLPINIHAGSSFRHPPTSLGWPSYLLEDYVAQSAGFAGVLNSLITEGVFVEFPHLKVVLMESGVTWLPAWIWRVNKTWRALRPEVPWNKIAPGEMLRRHVRATIQPFDAPPTLERTRKIIEEIDCEDLFLFSTDYPHWHFDGTDAIPDGLPETLTRKMLFENPVSTYPRLREQRP